MCHFLTVAVPGKTVPEVPKQFCRDIHFTEHSNRSISKYTPLDWTSFTATSGGCSCGFYRISHNASDDRFKLEKKYRKKGWSEAKIHRALEGHKSDPIQPAGLRDDIVDLVIYLTTAFGELRLLLHWYSGDIETENFSLKDNGSISLENFKLDTTALGDETTIKIKGEQGGAGQRR